MINFKIKLNVPPGGCQLRNFTRLNQSSFPVAHAHTRGVCDPEHQVQKNEKKKNDMSHQCPFCLEEFANVYCLGPHKRLCKKRFDAGLPSTDFSDEDGSRDSDADRPDEDDDSDNARPAWTVTTLWQLAQRGKHGVQSSHPLPPVGRNLFFPKFTADYVCLQKEWDEHTTAISTLFEREF